MSRDEYERRMAAMKSLCRKCVYGFPSYIGYSCTICPGKLCCEVVTDCNIFKPSFDYAEKYAKEKGR